MYNFPHAKFIELLKYKALLKNIVLIKVEESYTSKTSFIDKEELRVLKDIKKELNHDEEKNLTQGDENQLSQDKSQLIGKRIIHADVNGSFNIVRKVLLHFEFNKNIINLEYDLMELTHDDKRKLFNFYKFNKNKTEIKSKELISVLNCG